MMGNRISISFVNHTLEDQESVTICSHWAGLTLVRLAEAFVESLEPSRVLTPFTRREPSALIAPFLNMLEESFASTVEVVPTPKDCDDSDNGHWDIDVFTASAVRSPKEAKCDDNPGGKT